ncbi:hypothetical protein A3K64_04255 [Candidatus Micrarchaeota archaeon RBG_16_36_9]|nr:MAG: hypothetical protein A3K64_04255 [Candidatus Micrarchaeota archaeon RBG_16_36_9]
MIEKYACIVAKTNNPTYASLLESKGNHTPYTSVRRECDNMVIITPQNYAPEFEKFLSKRGIKDTIL